MDDKDFLEDIADQNKFGGTRKDAKGGSRKGKPNLFGPRKTKISTMQARSTTARKRKLT